MTQARLCKLVFASASDIADYYHRHYTHQPEHIYYQPDVYAGYRAQGKPPQIPDQIETSNAQFHTLHIDGQVLPQFFWDFTHRWSEPEWDAQSQLRNQAGLIIPERINGENCIPSQVNLSNAEVETVIEAIGDRVQVTLRFQLSKPFDFLPVAIWHLPLSGVDVHTPEDLTNTRWISVIDGVTGNLHGIVVCSHLPAGVSTRIVWLQGTLRAPRNANFRLGDALRGRTIYRMGTPYTYLWRADGIPPGQLTLSVPVNRDVVVHYNDGQTVRPDERGQLSIRFTDDWMFEVPLVNGLTLEDLQILAAYEMA